MKVQLEARNLELKARPRSVAGKLNGKSFIVLRQASEAGQLFGSVSARDIAAILADGGFTVTRNQIALHAPIKTIGMHTVPVALHPEVEVTITINVARNADEAERQARGENVTQRREEADEAAEAAAAAAASSRSPKTAPAIRAAARTRRPTERAPAAAPSGIGGSGKSSTIGAAAPARRRGGCRPRGGAQAASRTRLA